MKRVALSLNVPESVRDALDLRVKEGRAKGFPVERASLAAHLLATALRVDGVKESHAKVVLRAISALLGEIRPFVPALERRAEAALRGAGLAEEWIGPVMKAMGLEDDR